MARRTATVEQTAYIKGLITEANPLTFPEDASVDEKNFLLNRDGTRRRRLGIDYEDDYSIVSSEVSPSASSLTTFSSYQWENVNGDAESKIAVCQVGNKIFFFNSLELPLSGSLISSITLPISVSTRASFASVDGKLVIASGLKEIYVVEYKDGVISSNTQRLKIRDFFGLEDKEGSVDLTSSSGISLRPTIYNANHIYNLRNQSFGKPRLPWADSESSFLIDPILNFKYKTPFLAHYPSNADAVFYNLYPNPDPDDVADNVVERFSAKHLVGNPPKNTPAPKGFFIIDALERGVSRVEEYAALLDNDYPSAYRPYLYPISSLNRDETPGGASVVAEYAGRVWYGGFPGEVIDGDEKSPTLSSYILFSKLVQSPSDIKDCYQEEDPTSKDSAGIVDTDGGALRISGAYGINNLIPFVERLLVIAENGVWSVRGGDAGFTATEYTIEKLSDRGCSSPNSAVEIEGGVVFWGEDGIYLIGGDKFGEVVAKNISQSTIQSFYDDIPSFDKENAFAYYDSFDRKVRWLYGNYREEGTVPKELIFDIDFGAFVPIEYSTIGTSGPIPVCHVEVPPFRVGEATDVVVVGGDPVEASTDPVQVTTESLLTGQRNTFYLTLVEDDSLGRYQFTFSSLKDTRFKDWVSYDTAGVDAAAYIVTGYLSGGDTQREKIAPYLTTHFLRTENGFEETPSGDITPSNPSSCKVQAQWDWTNSANSNRWGREFQAYRYPRVYLPSDISDPYDTGDLLITTKSKLRGYGKALSLLFKTEPEKDCRIMGWSLKVLIEENV